MASFSKTQLEDAGVRGCQDNPSSRKSRVILRSDSRAVQSSAEGFRLAEGMPYFDGSTEKVMLISRGLAA